ncbi:type II toxin-antitoxin system VapC family toxin [Fulvimarina sp. 2208YS6-2-32]|uniref:Type II toxin-antitoxin system VapC family toxin n=1 Tax=Fulvimarina uroteuthidis TaxID=3098149 RepID=A0ABU5I5G7_9HYPH|nr:type II toxin-antitoxin system VapC family toxin [Fulvimarina sp. 2208YS6-2-32]MDY8110049.1 type II toxin-antitoxin system VapC family toxin [Fulvimarina sp. 2208YS6-2-32]
MIDTHVLLWWVLASPNLSNRAEALLRDDANEIFVSAISAFEIANKHRLGKLPEATPLIENFEEVVHSQKFQVAKLTAAQGLRAGQILSDHRDPFDRIIAVQAMDLAIPVITVDAKIASLGADTLW